MRHSTKLAIVVLIALVSAVGALAAETKRVRLVGARTAVAEAQWQARLEVRPAPRATPRVIAQDGRARVSVRVRPVAAGRYSLSASLPHAGRWMISARVGATRHSLGAVTVSAASIRLRSVLGIALLRDGGLLIADGDARRVLRADLGSGRMTTFASAGL